MAAFLKVAGIQFAAPATCAFTEAVIMPGTSLTVLERAGQRFARLKTLFGLMLFAR